jgi:hypothetical protein
LYFNKKRSLIAVILVLALVAGLLFFFNQPTSYQELGVEKQFRFVVMGDSRGDTTPVNEKRFSELMQNISQLSNEPKFILFAGDMVSGRGDIKENLSMWKKIANQYYPINKIYPAIGNHDGSEQTFSDIFRNLPMEQLKGYKRTAYYLDYGNSRFIVLNSNRKDKHGSYVIDDQQLAWLERLLKNSRKTHSFVMFHVPAYPMGAHYGSSLDRNPTQRDALWAILDKHKVTAVFVAHEHNYNRRIIDKNFNTEAAQYKNGIYQLTLGGAGAPLSDRSADNKNIVAGPYKKYHYMTVDIIGGLAVFNVYDINDNLIDSFEVARGSR